MEKLSRHYEAHLDIKVGEWPDCVAAQGEGVNNKASYISDISDEGETNIIRETVRKECAGISKPARIERYTHAHVN